MKTLKLVRKGKAFFIEAPEGTFSYYHPNFPFTRYSWDAQTAALLMIKHPIHSILILGLGGGTIARQCRMLLPNSKIIGVEIDPWVIKVAYRYFQLKSFKVNTIISSGQEYLKKTRRRFDAIIDDMWPAKPQIPKTIVEDPNWIHLVSKRLKPGGIYTINLYRKRESPDEKINVTARLKSLFPIVREIRPALGPTTVISAGTSLNKSQVVRKKLQDLPEPLCSGLGHVKFFNL